MWFHMDWQNLDEVVAVVKCILLRKHTSRRRVFSEHTRTQRHTRLLNSNLAYRTYGIALESEEDCYSAV
jgi:hypothetical protein